MSGNPNKISQFWQELRRRKVIKVMAMYGATAFIIMEAADIMLPRLGLPDWTVTLIIVLLIVGFPITIIISWIFDITPDGIRKTEAVETADEKDPSQAPVKRDFKPSDAIIIVLFISVCILLYPKLFPSDQFEEIRDTDGRISIAVVPFENQTGDTTLNWFQRGVSSLITNGLGSSPELAVRDDQVMYEVMESMDQVFTAGISPSQAKEVARKVHAETYISGSFQGRDGKYWILANLVSVADGDIILTKKVEGDLKSSDYLELANSLCIEIRNHLEIEVLEKEADYDFREAYTTSADAYRYYIEGMNSLLSKDYMSAVRSLKRALDIDSTFTFASFYIAFAYNYFSRAYIDTSAVWTQKTYEIKERLPLKYQLWVEVWYTMAFGKDLQAILRPLEILEGSGIESRFFWLDLGTTYYSMKYYEKAVEAFEKVEEISQERGEPWMYEDFYWPYGEALKYAGEYEKANEVYELSLQLFPNLINKREILWGLASCAFCRGDIIAGEEYLKNYISVKKELGETPDNIEFQIGYIYDSAKILDKAEFHWRKAIELDPQNRHYLHTLGKALIDEGIRIDEGMKLVDQALSMRPNNLWYNASKGWGFYKLGRYEEAMQLLNKANALHPSFLVEVDQRIRLVEQALAGQ